MAIAVSIQSIVQKGEIGLLAKNPRWGRVAVKEIAKIINGYPFDSKSFVNNSKQGTPLIRIRDIKNNNTEVNYVGSFDKEFLINEGDFLIGMDGNFELAIWRGPKGLLNQRVCKIVIDESKYDKKFFYYVMPGYLMAVHAHTSAQTVKHLSSRTIADTPLPNPPLQEQKQIVSEIEKQLTRLEASTQSLKSLKKKLEIYRKSVLKTAFRDITTFKEFTQVVDILDNRRVPINLAEREKREGTIPYYGATGQVGWIDDHIFNEELVLLGEDGAPFLEPYLQKAYLIIGKSWVNNHAHVLKGKNGLKNKFLLYWLNTIDYHKYVMGTTRLKLNQTRMKQIPIPVVSEKEQANIINTIEQNLSVIALVKETINKGLKSTERLKKSILKSAFEGKLVKEID